MGTPDPRSFLVHLREKDTRKHTARWATLKEGAVLLDRLEHHGHKIVMESGTANGYSTCFMATAKQNPIIYTYDVADRYKLWEREGPLKPLASQITFNLGRFNEDMCRRAKYISSNVFYFIDGDHRRAGIRQDWEAVSQFVKNGDVIMFHDSHTEEGVVYYVNLLRERLTRSKFTDFHTERGMTELVYNEQTKVR